MSFSLRALIRPKESASFEFESKEKYRQADLSLPGCAHRVYMTTAMSKICRGLHAGAAASFSSLVIS